VGKGKKAKRKIASKKTVEHKPPTKRWFKYLLFIGLLACSSGSNADVVASFYEPMPLQLSETANVKDEFKFMARLYNEKKYKDVIPVLNGFLDKKPDVKWNLYRGIAHFEMGDLVKAEEDFKVLANSANIYLADHGKWYQALSALKIGDNSSAKSILQALAKKPKGDYTQKAKQLLSKI